MDYRLDFFWCVSGPAQHRAAPFAIIEWFYSAPNSFNNWVLKNQKSTVVFISAHLIFNFKIILPMMSEHNFLHKRLNWARFWIFPKNSGPPLYINSRGVQDSCPVCPIIAPVLVWLKKPHIEQLWRTQTKLPSVMYFFFFFTIIVYNEIFVKCNKGNHFDSPCIYENML